MRLSVATAILLALMCQGGEVAETHGSDLSLGEIELAASKGPTQLRSVHCRFTDSGAKGKEYHNRNGYRDREHRPAIGPGGTVQGGAQALVLFVDVAT